MAGGGSVGTPSCTIPETVVSSATADPSVAAFNDVTEVAMAGVFPDLGPDQTPNVSIRLHVTRLGVNGALPPNQFWQVEFTPPGAPANTWYFVNLTTDST